MLYGARTFIPSRSAMRLLSPLVIVAYRLTLAIRLVQQELALFIARLVLIRRDRLKKLLLNYLIEFVALGGHGRALAPPHDCTEG